VSPLEFKLYPLALKVALYTAPLGLLLALQAEGFYIDLWRGSLTVLGTLLLLIGRSVLQSQKRLADELRLHRTEEARHIAEVKDFQEHLLTALIRYVLHAHPDQGSELVAVIDDVMREVRRKG